MSELDKGVILEEVSNLPPLLKARALGFMQGIAAASAESVPSGNDDGKGSDKEQDGDG